MLCMYNIIILKMVKKSITFSIDEEIISSILKEADTQDRSSSFIVNEILKENLENKNK